METRVAFECVARAHQDGEGGPDKLTVFEGQWAFCRFNAKADGHDWKKNEGLSLSMLRYTAAIKARDHVLDRAKTGSNL